MTIDRGTSSEMSEKVGGTSTAGPVMGLSRTSRCPRQAAVPVVRDALLSRTTIGGVGLCPDRRASGRNVRAVRHRINHDLFDALAFDTAVRKQRMR